MTYRESNETCNDIDVEVDEIAKLNRTRKRRRAAPLCDDEPPEELQEEITKRILRRAKAVRRKWSRDVYLKRQMKLPGQQRAGVAVISTPAGDTPCFGAGVAPAFMTNELRSFKQVYRDRKAHAKKESTS